MRAHDFTRWTLLLALAIGFGGMVSAGQVMVLSFDQQPVDQPLDSCGDGQDNDAAGDCEGVSGNIGWGGDDHGVCVFESTSGLGGDDHDQNFQLEPRIDCDEDNGNHGIRVEPLLDSEENVLGFEVRHADGREVLALCLRESYKNIESVSVSLDVRSMARIRKVPETGFTGGLVEALEVNEDVFVFRTTAFQPRSPGLNRQIMSDLIGAGYKVSETRNYLLIQQDPSRARIEYVRFASNEPAITSSEVSLEPPNYFDFPYCFPPEDNGFVGLAPRESVTGIRSSRR